MKTTLSLCCLLALSFTLFSQRIVPFVSYWSAGDTYEYKVTKIKQKWEGDSLAQNDSSSYIGKMTILDSTETSYKISWTYKTELAGIELPPDLLESLGKYELTEVIYTTSEVGDFTGIENWKEISEMTGNVFKEVINSLLKDEKNKKLSAKLEKAMKPLMANYSSKLGLERVIFKELQYLHYPFGVQYTEGEVIEYPESLPNMLGGDPIPGDVFLYIDSLNEEDQYCRLRQEMTLDPVKTKEAIVAGLKSMKLAPKEMEEILENSEMDIRDNNVYAYYYYPGVPIFIEANRQTVVNIGNDGGLRKNITRIELME